MRSKGCIHSVRIVTQVNDAHAAALVWALHRLGLDAEHVCLGERAADNDGVSFSTLSQSAEIFDLDPDLVWFRRPSRPVHLSGGAGKSADRIHAIANAEETLTVFLEGLEETVPAAIVLNRPSAIRRAANKVVNIYEACRAGLAVPETLITNSIMDANGFMAAIGGKAVYKPLRHNVWEVQPGVYAPARSTLIDISQLQESDGLHFPFILQQPVAKIAEWRMIYFASEVLVIQQDRPGQDAPIDWRNGARAQSRFSFVKPDAIFVKQVRELAERLNLQTFTADFAIASDGKPQFLDLNSAGQFLYLEEWSPTLDILAKVTDQLISAPPGTAAAAGISMAEFRQQVDMSRIKPKLYSSDLAGAPTRKSMICGRLD